MQSRRLNANKNKVFKKNFVSLHIKFYSTKKVFYKGYKTYKIFAKRYGYKE